jgi:hypothetical protein
LTSDFWEFLQAGTKIAIRSSKTPLMICVEFNGPYPELLVLKDVKKYSTRASAVAEAKMAAFIRLFIVFIN